MNAFTLCKKFIVAKTYSQETITTRVNTFYVFGQLTELEYTELMDLIDETYTKKTK